ncbi:MAG: molybdenum cofactor biosynthesis protein MoaE [Oleispira sp.]|nr:molybdenum cofactor biosynthesis protein MoaE [Oleispira sp.]
MISVQNEDFDFSAEYQLLRERSLQSGAIVMFVGLVRDFSENSQVSSMTLEHYPGMTEKVLNSIAEQASQRWPLDGIRIIHRVGEMHATDQIVLVGVSRDHRMAPYEASQFIMDILKTQAPFWKKESTKTQQGEAGERWVDAKSSDSKQAADWHE